MSKSRVSPETEMSGNHTLDPPALSTTLPSGIRLVDPRRREPASTISGSGKRSRSQVESQKEQPMASHQSGEPQPELLAQSLDSNDERVQREGIDITQVHSSPSSVRNANEASTLSAQCLTSPYRTPLSKEATASLCSATFATPDEPPRLTPSRFGQGARQLKPTRLATKLDLDQAQTANPVAKPPTRQPKRLPRARAPDTTTCSYSQFIPRRSQITQDSSLQPSTRLYRHRPRPSAFHVNVQSPLQSWETAERS
eukprot:m.293765 g.293765  ORF g.293765 m.293765 type:complete len:255 (+) comp31254_c0_seq1:213-977(+)